MASKETTKSGRCPICGERTEHAYRPFCSARCRDVDLGRWLGGGYAIPGGQIEAEDDGEAAATQRAGGRPQGDDDDAA